MPEIAPRGANAVRPIVRELPRGRRWTAATVRAAARAGETRERRAAAWRFWLGLAALAWMAGTLAGLLFVLAGGRL